MRTIKLSGGTSGMSFNGELEHFPLVDVVQLLHSTRKTGTLTLKGAKGESQLVFNDGFFVGANHLNNSVRIGQVLLEMGAVTQENLDNALQEQKRAGNERKPLVATLIDQGVINKDDAFKGLETLIEMTIVEVLTWKSGSFNLDVTQLELSDEYRYFPEKLHQEILLNAQGILMDALRIYDEKMRDGTLSELFFTTRDDEDQGENGSQADGRQDITADLLGLDELDTISRKIPDVFIGLKDHDPAGEHRQIISRMLPEADAAQSEKLALFLAGLTRSTAANSSLAVILLTRDELLGHCISSVCRHEGIFAFATDEESSLQIIIEQSLGRDLHPLLLIDSIHADSGESVLTIVTQKVALYPQISVMVAACCPLFHSISMQALAAGARAVMPRPCRQCHNDSYIPQSIDFLSSLGQFLTRISPQPSPEAERQFVSSLKQLKTLTEPPEVALLLLSFTATQFERAITFVIAKSELIAEKSIGVTSGRNEAPSAPLKFRIPLSEKSLLGEIATSGSVYYGQKTDPALTSTLYTHIEPPRSSKILILPLISRGKVIAMIYADFGSRPVTPPPLTLLEALTQCAGSHLDNALYRKSLEKTS